MRKRMKRNPNRGFKANHKKEDTAVKLYKFTTNNYN